jgi:hypothetical protein
MNWSTFTDQRRSNGHVPCLPAGEDCQACRADRLETGRAMLQNFDDYVDYFWLVKPKAATLDNLLKD